MKTTIYVWPQRPDSAAAPALADAAAAFVSVAAPALANAVAAFVSVIAWPFKPCFPDLI